MRLRAAPLSPAAAAVVAYWAAAFGRTPPKLNPKQAAKLDKFVGLYGTDRLQEACDWAAEKGLPEIDKAMNACRSKYEADHSPPPTGRAPPPNGQLSRQNYGPINLEEDQWKRLLGTP